MELWWPSGHGDQSSHPLTLQGVLGPGLTFTADTKVLRRLVCIYMLKVPY